MTEVTVTYAAGQNVSITTRNGALHKVTTWTSGVPGSTSRVTNGPVRPVVTKARPVRSLSRRRRRFVKP